MSIVTPQLGACTAAAFSTPWIFSAPERNMLWDDRQLDLSNYIPPARNVTALLADCFCSTWITKPMVDAKFQIAQCCPTEATGLPSRPFSQASRVQAERALAALADF